MRALPPIQHTTKVLWATLLPFQYLDFSEYFYTNACFLCAAVMNFDNILNIALYHS